MGGKSGSSSRFAPPLRWSRLGRPQSVGEAYNATHTDKEAI